MAKSYQHYKNDGYESDIDDTADPREHTRQSTLEVLNPSDESPPESPTETSHADSPTDASAPADVTRGQERSKVPRGGGSNPGCGNNAERLQRQGASAYPSSSSSSGSASSALLRSGAKLHQSPRNGTQLPPADNSQTTDDRYHNFYLNHTRHGGSRRDQRWSPANHHEDMDDDQRPERANEWRDPTRNFPVEHNVYLDGRCALFTVAGVADNFPNREMRRQRNRSLRESWSRDNERREKRKRIAEKCCVVFFVLTVLGVVGGIMVLFLPSLAASASTFFATGTVHMRVKEPFHEDLQDLTSTISVNYTTRLCREMTATLKTVSKVNEIKSCTINSYSNGSIIVVMKLELLLRSNTSQSDLQTNVLKKSGRLQGDLLLFGDVPVFKDSIRVTNFSVLVSGTSATDTATTTTTTTTMTTTMMMTTTTAAAATSGEPSSGASEFDCSVGGELYKPYNDAYPFHCGSYQRCQNGQGIPQHCDTGLEFGYDPGNNLGPCRHPSNATHCGQKRREESMTSPRVTTTMTSSVAMTSRAMLDACAALDPLILNNSASLYSCKESEPQSFQPFKDTYPDRCDSYQWCQNGQVLENKTCAAGAHFVYGNRSTESCDQPGKSTTFCEQMKLAESCR